MGYLMPVFLCPRCADPRCTQLGLYWSPADRLVPVYQCKGCLGAFAPTGGRGEVEVFKVPRKRGRVIKSPSRVRRFWRAILVRWSA